MAKIGDLFKEGCGYLPDLERCHLIVIIMSSKQKIDYWVFCIFKLNGKTSVMKEWGKTII